jgi:hypothetical protein
VALGLRAGGRLLPAVAQPARPIFVVGSPRSGTTVTFEVLDASPDVASLGAESHLVWDAFPSSRDLSRTSWTRLTPADVGAAERRASWWAVDRVAGGRRYLDKAPANSFRVPYLRALFPDASFVFVVRDGRDVVASLLEGWRDDGGMFPGKRVAGPLDIEGYDGDTWKFVMPPGWEAYASGRRLPDVCAFQWVACNQALLDAREVVDPVRWIEVRYEDLRADPDGCVRRLLDAVGLAPDPAVLDRARHLERHPAKAVAGAPAHASWEDRAGPEVRSVLPALEPTLRRLGYHVG